VPLPPPAATRPHLMRRRMTHDDVIHGMAGFSPPSASGPEYCTLSSLPSSHLLFPSPRPFSSSFLLFISPRHFSSSFLLSHLLFPSLHFASCPVQVGQYEEVLGTLLLFGESPGPSLTRNPTSGPNSNTQATPILTPNTVSNNSPQAEPAATPNADGNTNTATNPSADTEAQKGPNSSTDARTDTAGVSNTQTSSTVRFYGKSRVRLRFSQQEPLSADTNSALHHRKIAS